MMGKFVDLKGKTYGRLTVIERAENRGKKVAWLCKCECGNEKVVIGHHLKNNSIKSCGCYNKEKAQEHIQKVNEQQWEDEEFRQKHSERSSEQMKQLWEDDSFRQMQSEKCREQMKQQKGDKNPNYKGGITPISIHLRNLTKQWDKDVRQHYNKKCVLTGKKCTLKNSAVHHLYGFNMIVEDAHKINNIEVKSQVKYYTDEELQLLEEYVLSLHNDTSNGVLLCNEVHKLFHRSKKDGGYGYGDNTPEQFEEFRQRYLNGEFDKELNPTNNKVA